MAYPVANWEEWSQPSIEPFMQFVIHFPTGNVTIYDGNISNVSVDGRMFESSSILFGPPEPTEASVDIVDYDQEYNPVLNSALVAGIQVDLFLGLRLYDEENLGPAKIIQYDPDQQVLYDGQEVWATVFHTESMLVPGHRYLLVYDYTLDGEEVIRERVEIPYDWFDRTIYAITHEEEITVIDAQLYEILSEYAPYGVFYAREWSYDTTSHIATIDLVDNMNDALMFDNRVDGPKPNTDVDLRTFTTSLLNLYSTVEPLIAEDVYTTTLLLSFYEDTQASTVANLVQACQAAYFFLPDGSAVLCPFTGAYDTEIIITDEDVITYNIQQTSAVSFDSVVVDQANVYLEQIKVIDYTDLDLSAHPIIPFTASRLFNLEYVLGTKTNGTASWVYYTWSIAGLDYGSSEWPALEAWGTCVQSNAIPVSIGASGTLPYEIKNNCYIQTDAHARAICSNIEQFLALRYNTVEFTLRGCPSLWQGARIHLQSNLYNIDADYVVIENHFNYNGAVSTTIVAQRSF